MSCLLWCKWHLTLLFLCFPMQHVRKKNDKNGSLPQLSRVYVSAFMWPKETEREGRSFIFSFYKSIIFEKQVLLLLKSVHNDQWFLYSCQIRFDYKTKLCSKHIGLFISPCSNLYFISKPRQSSMGDNLRLNFGNKEWCFFELSSFTTVWSYKIFTRLVRVS